MRLLLVLLIIVVVVDLGDSFKFLFKKTWTQLSAKKFDPADCVSVTINKPLGLTLEENEEDGNQGVFVGDLAPGGNGAASGKIKKGYYLLSVNGVDVRYKDFDSVMKTFSSPKESVDLVFIPKLTVTRGPAILTVRNPEGKTVQIKTVKGQNLRTVLTGSGVEIYDAKAKWSNCGAAGQCGTCAVRVTDNQYWDQRPDFEAKRLKKFDSSCRLSCNTIIEGDCTVDTFPPKSG